uniref:Putative TniA transposase n=1 Tax=Rhodococcus hoagii TaxID=43767 RepID=A0A1Z1UXB4_RHOHA|nr:putative TniA transposase [Prescottella equi]
MLTLAELERWLTLVVARYHGTEHAGLGQTPAGRWEQEVLLSGVPTLAAHPTAFLVDFLPVVRRRVTRVPGSSSTTCTTSPTPSNRGSAAERRWASS